MTHYLTLSEVRQLLARVQVHLVAQGPAALAWQDEPAWELGVAEVARVYQAKLNGVYTERFVLTLALLPSLVQRGHRVALVQKHDSEWLVLSINQYPLFHWSPDNLPPLDPAWITHDADHQHEWKGTDKVEEFTLLLQWCQDP